MSRKLRKKALKAAARIQDKLPAVADVVEAELSYRELQALAKSKGIRANQSRANLVSALF